MQVVYIHRLQKLRIVVVRGDVGTTGLSLHDQLGHSMLPAGLVAEIRALVHPPLTWDVALARWFDEHFPAVERQRSYARPSRRQAANPAVPMSGYRRPEEAVARRTFGVVLDTSGSVTHELLGRALGAVASYAAARGTWLQPGIDLLGRARLPGDRADPGDHRRRV